MLAKNDFYLILNSVSNPVQVVSPVYGPDNRIIDFTIEYVNRAYCEMTHNLTREGDRLSSLRRLLAPSVDWFSLGVRTLTENRTFSASYYSPNTNTWFCMTISKAKENLCVITLTNISAAKKQEKKLAYQAYHDMLTGLPNRAYFNQIFDTAIADTLKNKQLLALMLIDVDNMKAVNDILGHIAGDKILKTCAGILGKFKENNFQPFRLGDDEFLVLITGIVSKDELVTVSDAVFEAFQKADINVSAGIVLCPKDNTLSNNLLKYADLAMHSAKKEGKNTVVFFNPMMFDSFLDRTVLQRKLLKATEKSSFELYFQPQFNIKTNELRGFEALLRWYDETLGWVKPDDFIPLAEETRAILRLGQWVLETAVSTLKQWQVESGYGGILSVNVSPSQLKKNSFIFDLLDLLKRYNVRPGSLELEITESTFIDDMEQTITILSQIRDMGILVSLDDFGSGYSSFRYLQQLPINTLKIDKAFISNLTSPDSIEADITGSIVALVSKMGLETIAEGVERTEQLDILKAMNCNTIQGFLFGKPMKKSRCDAVIKGDMSALVRTGSEPVHMIKIRRLESS